MFYNKIFKVSLNSLENESVYTALFKNHIDKKRALTSLSENKYYFSPSVIHHDKDSIKIALNFENPQVLSIGKKAEIEISVEEPTVFKSANNLKPLMHKHFKNGVSKLKMELPP